ncbi:hypothetical protein MHU86_22855 [Fragilaria crotonensis]|nr:hypothetical protein MHU86_22855 [Fragilaria crotonensis]
MMEELHALHTGQHHQHDHSSDTDYDSDDDEEPDVVRRRKLSDDRSFHSLSIPSGKLHHRTSRQPANGDDLRSQSMSPLRHNGRRGKVVVATKKRTLWGRTMRWFILMLVIGYLFLMFCGYLWMRRHHSFYSESISSRSSFLEPKGRVFILRERLEQKRLDERNDQITQSINNAAQRARRTRPPRLLLAVEQYEIIATKPKRSMATRVTTPAKLQDLCGEHAKEASRSNPEAYASENALNSKSRVVITGILNPIGFHLALALKERCGVEVISGIDSAFPNTVAHRLALQNRIELLSTNIPKLVQPILQPFVGLDPKTSKKTPVDELPTTGEIDLLQLKSSHIVHLASYSMNEYQDFGDDEIRNTQSPYVAPGKASDMFGIRSSHVGMEQILLSLTEGELKIREREPQFIYASTAASDNTMFKRAKLVDEVLADVYSSLHGIYSNGVRLPGVVYGPWGRDGSQIHDLSKAAIDHHRRNNGTSITINDTQYRDFVFIDDIIDAIIAAMQYREPSQRSTLLDLSSDLHSTLKSVSIFVSRLVQSKSNKQLRDMSGPKTNRIEPTDLVENTRNVLKWSPTTSLPVGLAKTVVWYLDAAFPYGNKVDSEAMLLTGDQLRKRLESRLVNAVVKKVPESQLGQFGIKPGTNEPSDAYKKRKIEGLNGRLLYKGWILVWVKGAHKTLATHDMSMLKLSPGRFFASDVHHALFVDESFPVSPTHDDVLFLVGQVHRPPLPERNAYRKLENGKKRKYHLSAEPERRAVMLMSPLKYKKTTEAGELSKISTYEATKYMQVEIGENPEKNRAASKSSASSMNECLLSPIA